VRGHGAFLALLDVPALQDAPAPQDAPALQDAPAPQDAPALQDAGGDTAGAAADAAWTYVSLGQRSTPFGRLPEIFSGGKALVLTAQGHQIVTLPHVLPQERATRFRGTLRLGPELDCDATIQVEDGRSSSMAQKDSLRTLQGFRKGMVLQGLAGRLFPGGRLRKGDFVGLDDPAAPFRVDLEVAAPKLLQPSNDEFLLKAVLQPASLVRNYCGRTERQHPLHLRNAHVTLDKLVVEPGEHYQIRRLPDDTALSSTLGTYSLTYRRNADDAVVVEREMTLQPGQISPEEFKTFVAFCQQADAAEQESLVFQKRS
jgi:hypothetical protein